jgi:hypothetical protein
VQCWLKAEQLVHASKTLSEFKFTETEVVRIHQASAGKLIMITRCQLESSQAVRVIDVSELWAEPSNSSKRYLLTATANHELGCSATRIIDCYRVGFQMQVRSGSQCVEKGNRRASELRKTQQGAPQPLLLQQLGM